MVSLVPMERRGKPDTMCDSVYVFASITNGSDQSQLKCGLSSGLCSGAIRLIGPSRIWFRLQRARASRIAQSPAIPLAITGCCQQPERRPVVFLLVPTVTFGFNHAIPPASCFILAVILRSHSLLLEYEYLLPAGKVVSANLFLADSTPKPVTPL